MTFIIKKNFKKEEIQKIFDQLTSERKFDAFKYCGKLRLTVDPLAFQKKMRNEWE